MHFGTPHAIIKHEKVGLYWKGIKMNLREMAEAHLRNVEQQIQELQQNKARIEQDIQTLSDYLQQGVAELNAGNQDANPEQAMNQQGQDFIDGKQVSPSIPTLTLPQQG
ncbi:MAG: hypothetical protein FI729_03165 [SAR202 cluster bacterium]|nr:hypothetical protein [SAR202 cluster bacterium]